MSLRPYEQRPALAAWGRVRREIARRQAKEGRSVTVSDVIGDGCEPAWTELPADVGGSPLSSCVPGINWSLCAALPLVRGRRDYSLPVEESNAYESHTWLGALDRLTVRCRSDFQRKHLGRIVEVGRQAAADAAELEDRAAAALRAVGWDEARAVFARLMGQECPKTYERTPEGRRERRIDRLAAAVLRALKMRAGVRPELGDEADPLLVEAKLTELGALCLEIAGIVATARSQAKFHAHRAGAQRKRFSSHKRCGQGVAVAHCACGYEKGMPVGCDISRLCVACRERQMKKRRSRFALARDRVMRSDRRRVPFEGYHRWSEKHVVLTIPHFGTGRGAPRARIEALWKAREHFGRLMQGHWRRKRVTGVRYLRGFEWTPGSDGLGHPHLHVWFWSPFIEEDSVRRWWARALRSAGVPNVPERPTPSQLRITVRQVTIRKKEIIRETAKGARSIKLEVLSGGQDVVGYLETWAVSEVREDGRIVAPWIMAEVYAALEGKRQTQASRGFLGLADRECACPDCGSVGAFVVAVFPAGSPNARIWAEHFGLDIARPRDGPSVRKGVRHDEQTRTTGPGRSNSSREKAG